MISATFLAHVAQDEALFYLITAGLQHFTIIVTYGHNYLLFEFT